MQPKFKMASGLPLHTQLICSSEVLFLSVCVGDFLNWTQHILEWDWFKLISQKQWLKSVLPKLSTAGKRRILNCFRLQMAFMLGFFSPAAQFLFLFFYIGEKTYFDTGIS